MIEAPEPHEEKGQDAQKERHPGQPAEEAALLGEGPHQRIEEQQHQENCQHLPHRKGEGRGDAAQEGHRLPGKVGVEVKKRRHIGRHGHQGQGQQHKDGGEDQSSDGSHEEVPFWESLERGGFPGAVVLLYHNFPQNKSAQGNLPKSPARQAVSLTFAAARI